MIDNLQLIKPLLSFEQPGDFYMLYILKRKKDQTTDKSNHQSVRTIKSYCIESIEQLDNRWSEIVTLCEVFHARAYIHIQKQNHQDVSLEMIQTIIKRMQSAQTNQQHVFDSVVGQIKTYEKRWIVDIDTKEEEVVHRIARLINEIRPQNPKIEAVIPTPMGYHLITCRFDVTQFKKHYPEIDIQKKNPTLLYYPNSLEQ